MDIELLKTFLEVKNTRHFGQAAENLYLTQAAVSARIKQLESILGSPLFTRYRNNLQLTPSGKRLIPHAETILIAWERTRSELAVTKGTRRELAFGATSGLWDLIMQDTMNLVHQSMPDITLRAESHGQDVLIRRLVERTLDLALVYEPAKITDLVSKAVYETELVLVSAQRKITLDQACEQGYVAVDWGTAFEVNYAKAFQNAPSPVLHTTLARIALEFIVTHGGSAYLPLGMIENYHQAELFVIEDAPRFERVVYACYHIESQQRELLEQVIELFHEAHC